MEDEAEAGEAVGAAPIELQRFLDEDERGIEPAAPIVDLAQGPVQGVEIAGLLMQHCVEKALGDGKIAACESALRAPHHAR